MGKHHRHAKGRNGGDQECSDCHVNLLALDFSLGSREQAAIIRAVARLVGLLAAATVVET
jgi:hypothetical protein